MLKQEILQIVFDKLRFAGAVRSKREFAEKIDYNYTSLSAAFNGEPRYLNDRFFSRILRAFPQVSETFIRTGEGPVLLDADPMTGEVYDNTGGTGINPIPSAQQPQPHPQSYTVDMESVMAALTEQQELTRRQQEQTEKALSQIDKLIEIIRTMSITTDSE